MSDVNVSSAALVDVYSALKEFQNNIEALPPDVSANIDSLVCACENEIRNVNAKLRQLEQEKYSLEISLQSVKQSIVTCESQISSVEDKISALQAALSDVSNSVPDAKEKSQEIDSQISAFESKLATLHKELICYERERNEIWQDRNEKIKEIYRTKNKIDRMDAAFSVVQSSSWALKAKVDKFCLRASEISSTNASSVALCFNCLEKYMNTDL